jgi:hypothetical protein
LKLMDLRIGGQCNFELPEWLFNMDYADHYMRRIKSVSVSLPCVVGPYTGVSGKLTMLSGKVRVSPTPGQGYADESNYRGSQLGASSIAVSSAQGDAGLFEFNLRDERFLPFEGGGLVDSQWRFELPGHVRQFDYETISDLVLTIRYTARSSAALKQPAIAALKKHFEEDAPPVLIDLKRDFPSVWAQRNGTNPLSGITLTGDHLPYAWAKKAALASSQRTCWVKRTSDQSWLPLSVQMSVAQPGWSLTVALPALTDPWTSYEEALISIQYTVPPPT